MITEILHQDTYWRTKDGRETRLDMMTVEHRRNLRRFLRRNAKSLKSSEELDALYFIPTLRGEMASYYAEREFDILMEQHSVQWLMQTELYRELVKLCWRDRKHERVAAG